MAKHDTRSGRLPASCYTMMTACLLGLGMVLAIELAMR